MEVRTVDDVLKIFNIDKSKIIIDEEELKIANEPMPFKISNSNRKVLIVGTYEEKWLDIVECEDFFIIFMDNMKPKQIDKKTGEIKDYKVLVH